METKEERMPRIDRRAFIKRIFRPLDRLSVATRQKTRNITVFLCSCRGKNSIDMKELATFVKKLRVKDVILQNELCGIDGRAYFKMIAEENPENILVATCTKNLVFYNIATRLKYPVSSLHMLELRELCDWVHDDKSKATEKGKRMLASALAGIYMRMSDETRPGRTKLVVSKAIDPSEVKILYGKLEACPASEDICAVCRDFCPQNAITYSEQGIRIDRRLCNVCGICEKTCPQDLLEIIPRDDPSQILSQMLTESQEILGLKEEKEILATEIVAFVCENRAKTSLIRLGLQKDKYPADVLPVFVRCLSDLSPNLILKAFSGGAQGVIVIGCDDCLYDSQKYLNNLTGMIEGIFDRSALESRLAMIRSNGKDSDKILESLVNFYDEIGYKEKMNEKELINLSLKSESIHSPGAQY